MTRSAGRCASACLAALLWAAPATPARAYEALARAFPVEGSAAGCGTEVRYTGEVRLVVHVELVDSSSEMLGVLLECDAAGLVAASGDATFSPGAREVVELIVAAPYPREEEQAAEVLLVSRDPEPLRLRLRLPFGIVVTGSGDVSASLQAERVTLRCDGADPALADAGAAPAAGR